MRTKYIEMNCMMHDHTAIVLKCMVHGNTCIGVDFNEVMCILGTIYF